MLSSSSSSTPLTLILDPDNPVNTNISDSDDGRIMYQVVTQHSGKEPVTRVRNVYGDTIASWEWRDMRSDKITLGNGPPVSVSAWLKKSVVPFKDTVTFQDHSGRTFKWKGNAPGLPLELYSEDDKRHPVARFMKSHRNRGSPSIELQSNAPRWTPATLMLDARAKEIMDLVVISFLVLEKNRRATENATMNRADTIAQPIVGPGYR